MRLPYVRSLALLAAVSGLLLFGTTSPSQEKTEAKPGPRPDAKTLVAQMTLKQMSRDLALTEEQKTKIKPILIEECDKLAVIQDDQSLSPVEKNAKCTACREVYRVKLKPVLTAEQADKWEQLRNKKSRQNPDHDHNH
jgi:Spy/CpxP family protein refolding chaperone